MFGSCTYATLDFLPEFRTRFVILACIGHRLLHLHALQCIGCARGAPAQVGSEFLLLCRWQFPVNVGIEFFGERFTRHGNLLSRPRSIWNAALYARDERATSPCRSVSPEPGRFRHKPYPRRHRAEESLERTQAIPAMPRGQPCGRPYR